MECRESEGFFYDSNNKPGICTTLPEEKILISEITGSFGSPDFYPLCRILQLKHTTNQKSKHC